MKWGDAYTFACETCGEVRTVKFRTNRTYRYCQRCSVQGLDRPWLTSHGATKTPLYAVWCQMRWRCEKADHPEYENYGGRGITVCDRWQDFAVFKLWAFAQGYQRGLFIDREDNERGYTAENCRWVTPCVSARNRRGQLTVERVVLIKGMIVEGWSWQAVHACVGLSRRGYFAIKGRERWVDVVPAEVFAPSMAIG